MYFCLCQLTIPVLWRFENKVNFRSSESITSSCLMLCQVLTKISIDNWRNSEWRDCIYSDYPESWRKETKSRRRRNQRFRKARRAEAELAQTMPWRKSEDVNHFLLLTSSRYYIVTNNLKPVFSLRDIFV